MAGLPGTNKWLWVKPPLSAKLVLSRLFNAVGVCPSLVNVVSLPPTQVGAADPNAAVYYLARMVEGGEDPKFIASRLDILASEDIGLANPNALLLATATFEAIERIGWPEGRIMLSQCAIYLASSPKSNAAYKAIGEAQSKVRETGALSVPLHLRNAPTQLMKDLGYGRNYEYSHDYDRGFSPQEYLPGEIKGTRFYTPGNNPAEGKLQAYLKSLWGDTYKY